jgi:Uma2 family endonuclease
MNKIGTPEQVVIPTRVTDHGSFRRWACSEEFPERKRFTYLDGSLWVDLNLERFNHNKIKTSIACVLTRHVHDQNLGHFLGDRMLLTNLSGSFSTEPDGMFLSHESLESGQVSAPDRDDSLEVLGTPDMVLEVVSPTSVQKESTRGRLFVLLRDLYWKAGIPEYWFVDIRSRSAQLEILRNTPARYVATRKQAGWARSVVFGKEFRLTRRDAGQGLSHYSLEMR